MLSLITFTAVVFLAVTMREKDAVLVSEDMMDAKTLAEVGLMEAEVRVASGMLARKNISDYDLMVSETTVPSPLISATPPPESSLSVISNLIYDARPPVYVQTNENASLPWKHSFYLDFNRNGHFEPTGWLEETNDAGVAMGITNYYVGDPQWIGILQFSIPTNNVAERPAHSRTNKFVGRVAYMVMPYGKSLDINYLHNSAKKLNPTMPGKTDGYRRNQGVGTYELNGAAFLADLNTNVWSAANYWTTLNAIAAPYYEYFTNLTTTNLGLAFIDAEALLSYRYNANYDNLNSLNNLYGNPATTVLTNDLVDHYIRHPLMMTQLRLPTNDFDNTTLSWPGSVNTNAAAGSFFDINELFLTGRSYSSIPNPVDDNFRYRLLSVSSNLSSYNRYTTYRMLAQLGTESSLAAGERVHLNYDNRVPNSTTDFKGWYPTNFFNETAERLLRTNYNISLTDYAHTNRIEIYPTNRYSVAIHRMLQVTANIYDATTNRNQDVYPYYPTVFRPIFTNDNGVISIIRYDEVTGTNEAYYGYLPRDFASTNVTYRNTLISSNNIWGVPWIIGAKKGFPNFNEFELYSTILMTRRLEFIKNNTNMPVVIRQTNQLYTLGISNMLGAEMWYPYTNPYPRNLMVMAQLHAFTHLTNQSGSIRNNLLVVSNAAPVAAGSWANGPLGFRLPFNINDVFLTNSVYYNSTGQFIPTTDISGTNVVYERGQQFYTPQWGLSMSNRMFAVIMDTDASGGARVVDYVNFDSFTFGVDDLSSRLTGAASLPDSAGTVNQSLIQSLFNTNRVNGGTNNNSPTVGIRQQIAVALGLVPVGQTDWNNYSLTGPSLMDKQQSIATFQRFMVGTVGGTQVGQFHSRPSGPPQYFVRMPTTTNMQSPFTAVAKMVFTNNWQANDPLVHYTVQDMSDPNGVNLLPFLIRPFNSPTVTNNLRMVNQRYRPWGVLRGDGISAAMGYGDPPGGIDAGQLDNDYSFNLYAKDPQVRKPDDWDFPGQKFANVGWLGRVHRGTPWQTIYMKAGMMNPESWARWANTTANHPTNDWLLPDFFTTATDVRSVSGLLSVNQTNLAAWSAVLGNVLVLTNTMNFNDSTTNITSTNAVGIPITYDDIMINPGSDHLKFMVEGINRVRRNRVANYGGGLQTTNAFLRMGDILSVPELTVGDSPAVRSPYLDLYDRNLFYGVHDAAIERIPQQVLGLLKVDDMPRVVVYAWGQSLKPAPNSVVLSGAYRGMVTNYSVVSEHLTRTVLRFEGGPRNPRAVVENFTVIPSE